MSAGPPTPRTATPRLIAIEERGLRAVAVAAVALEEIPAERKAHLGTRNFTQLHQILQQLRDIAAPRSRQSRPTPSHPRPNPGVSTRRRPPTYTHISLDIVRFID